MKNGIDCEQASQNVFKLLDHRLNPSVIRQIRWAMGGSVDPLWPVRKGSTGTE
jgi:uncharacterized protein (DUF2267 family)